MSDVRYQVQFSVDHPDRPLERMTTFFGIFLAIPILIALRGVLGGALPGGRHALVPGY
jgi:hypothetical protein